MENEPNQPWERLKTVIRVSGAPSTNAFAVLIGLKKPETLYRIEKGKNGISRVLAKRINTHFPQFDIPWLTCGGKMPPDPITQQESNRLISIPVYEDLGTRCFRQSVCLPFAMAKGATIALLLKKELLNDHQPPKGSILLLKKTDNKIKYGDMHLVCTDSLNSMCIIKRCRPKEKVILSPIQADLFSDIVIEKAKIRELYVVCGFFSMV